MDSTRTTSSGAAAAPARAVVPATANPTPTVRPVRTAVAAAAAPVRRSAGYGLPCSKCHLYYPANLPACPICRTTERVSPKVAAVKMSAAPVAPSEAVLDEERERFLREYKAKLYAATPRLTLPVSNAAQRRPGRSGARACFDLQNLQRSTAAPPIASRLRCTSIYGKPRRLSTMQSGLIPQTPARPTKTQLSPF